VALTNDGPSRFETPPGGTSSHRDVLAAARGWGFLAGGRAVEFCSRFLVALLLARVLGVRDYGLYTLAISAVTLVAGVSLLGLDQAVVRYVAILSGRRDRAGIWGTIQVGLGVGTAVGAAMGGALYLGSSAIAGGFFDEPRLTPLLQMLAVVVPFLVISEMLAATARGFRRMDYAAFADTVVQSVVRILLLGALALIGRLDVLTSAIVFGIADVASTITLIIVLNRLLPLRTAVHEGGRRDVKPIVGFALPLWLAELVFQFRKNVLTITLGTLSTVASVGIFTVASRVSSVGHTVLVALVSAIRPILAQLHDRADRAGLAHLYTTATRWMLTLNLPFFLIIVLYSEILLSLFGETFRAGAAALVIIGTAELINAATGICGPMIDMTGHVKIKLANSILRVAVLVTASALLIPIWGVVGAATAGLLSVAVVNAVAIVEMWILEGLVPFERHVWKPLTAAVAAFLVGFGLKSVLPIGRDWWVAALQAGIVLGVYAGMIIGFGLSPDDRMVLDRGRRKVQRFIRRRPAEPEAAAGVR
jgi:O-antigen/teichoic acid export membrane protein